MIRLCLDLAGSTGWCVGANGNVISGVWDIRPRRGESPGMRYIHLRAKLEAIRAAYPALSFVAYEQVHHRGGAATEYAAGCVATVQAWCAEHGINHTSVHTGTIKRHATGKGNANKQAMIEAARSWGYAPADDNEADALAILRWATQGKVKEAAE